jgi:hypothetical protein
MEKTDIKKLLNDTFSEIALVLSGIFIVHNTPEETASQIMKHLDLTHENILSKLDEMRSRASKTSQSRQPYELHPAVAAFLIKLKKSGYSNGRTE